MPETCAVCGQGFTGIKPFGRQHRAHECILCRRRIGSSCLRIGASRDGRSGPICLSCWQTHADEFVPEFASLSDAIRGFLPAARQQIDVIRGDIKSDLQEIRESLKGDIREVTDRIRADTYAVKSDLLRDARELKEEVRADIDRQLAKVNDLVTGWLRQAQSQIDRSIQKGFGYLWITLTATLFLTFVGLFYFGAIRGGGVPPEAALAPAMIFRIGLAVLVGVPTLLWFASALGRALRNARLEDYLREKRGGRALGLRDYLFGFLYFRDPVQNIWGPVLFLGALFAAVLYLLTRFRAPV